MSVNGLVWIGVVAAVLSMLTQVATLKDKAKETVQVVTYNRHHYL
ncbi:MAG: hypothetical protein DFNUSKGM_002773 [Candidatus Fervidibacter sacchari]